ncbi:MAG TPA: hypothetical protein DCM08_07425 [Microscillaceae bacterium]|jgi:uncharacterized protein (AIM24 family)|nr:hypothetical protein [Microscillaceae bacterium]
MKADTIGYRILDDPNAVQILEINLEPQRTLLADAAALLYVDEEVAIEVKTDIEIAQAQNTWGDDPRASDEDDDDETPPVFEEEQEKPLVEKLWFAVKNLFKPEGQEAPEGLPEDVWANDAPAFEPEEKPQPRLHLTHFVNQSEYIRTVAFSSPSFGKIVPINVDELSNASLVFQQGAFLCAAKGAWFEPYKATQLNLASGLRLDFALEELQGGGMVFLHAGGKVVEKKLQEDAIQVNIFSIVAFETSLSLDLYNLQRLSSLYGRGETALVTLTGSGRLWLQTTNIQQLAQSVAPWMAKSDQEEQGFEQDSFGLPADQDISLDDDQLSDEELFRRLNL